MSIVGIGYFTKFPITIFCGFIVWKPLKSYKEELFKTQLMWLVWFY